MKQHDWVRCTTIGMAIGILAGFAISTSSFADQVTLEPAKDNTLFSTGDTSNGAGPQFFSGRTGAFRGFIKQRAVLEFDVATTVPAGATITSVTLTLHLERAGNTVNELHSLHRVLAEWGEGTSAAAGGTGALVTVGDVTWSHTFYPDQFWANEGGDFDASSSAEQFVPPVDFGTVPPVTWGSTDGMVADVQFWLDHPEDNHGWLLHGNEGGENTARKFSSREHNVIEQRPVLTIEFELPPPCPADVNDDGAVDLFDLLLVIKAMYEEGDVPEDLDGDGIVTPHDLFIVLRNLGPCPASPEDCPGDVNGDGSVDVIDLLRVIHNFNAVGDLEEDLDGDGLVSVTDLLIVLSNFGPCPE